MIWYADMSNALLQQGLCSMYECICVCVYVFVYACMHVCVFVYIYVCMHVCVYVCMIRMYVYMHVCMCVHMYICMHVCAQEECAGYVVCGCDLDLIHATHATCVTLHENLFPSVVFVCTCVFVRVFMRACQCTSEFRVFTCVFVCLYLCMSIYF
jgi:hypothetical protein